MLVSHFIGTASQALQVKPKINTIEKQHPILDDEKKQHPFSKEKNLVRTYCWWFRNPIPNHRLDGATTL